MNSGIYNIRNIINDNIYIGSSIRIKERWAAHRNLLKRGKHHCKKLQDEYKEFGMENFIYEIIQYSEGDLIKEELRWLNFFKPEYNTIKRPDYPPMTGRKHSKESLEKMSKSQKGKVRNTSPTKICTICGETKLKELFERNRNKCKECRKEYHSKRMKIIRDSNPEKQKEIRKRTRLKFKDKRYAYSREWFKNNPEARIRYNEKRKNQKVQTDPNDMEKNK